MVIFQEDFPSDFQHVNIPSDTRFLCWEIPQLNRSFCRRITCGVLTAKLHWQWFCNILNGTARLSTICTHPFILTLSPHTRNEESQELLLTGMQCAQAWNGWTYHKPLENIRDMIENHDARWANPIIPLS